MEAVRKAIEPHWSLDVGAAAAAIRIRDPRCAPGLDMELSMVADHQARA
jgi:hypothetical protein